MRRRGWPLHRTAELWAQPVRWKRLQGNGMRTDVSWAGPAKQYAGLYAELLATNN